MSSATIRACDALLPNIAEAFAVSVSTAAIAITAFTFAYGAFQLAYGPIGARFGPYRLVIVATVLAATGSFFCASATSLAWLTAGRFWSGMTAAAIIPMSLVHIGNTVPYEQRQTVIAQFLVGQASGIIFGQAFAGFFAELLTWRQLFVTLGIGFLLIAVALFRELQKGQVNEGERISSPSSPAVQYLRILSLPWARVVLITVAIEGFLCFGAFPYSAAQMRLGFELDYLTIGLIMSLIGVGGLIYMFTVRWLLARLGETGLALVGGALLFIGFGLMAVANDWRWFIPALLLVGLGYYMFHNTLQTNATQMAPFDRSSAIALFAFVLFLGQALGAALMGYTAEFTGFRFVFVLAGGGLVVLAGYFALARRRKEEVVQ